MFLFTGNNQLNKTASYILYCTQCNEIMEFYNDPIVSWPYN